MGVIVISKVFIAFLAIGNGWIGAEWHISYTVAQRFESSIILSVVLLLNSNQQNHTWNVWFLRRYLNENHPVNRLVCFPGMARRSMRVCHD
jgi:hypothetical protein